MTIAEPAPPRESPVPDERWATRELRLAVVCYGGVSLAIYMHGVTKEIHKLVLASAALEREPDSGNPFEKDTTEHVYWDILKRVSAGGLGGHAAGANIRVVVDIITGTSAGGINGIFLAKALTGNRPQDGLRKLWFEKGDIKVLLEWPTWIPWPARFLAMAVARRKPPLRGGDMSKWLYGALKDMNGKKVLPGADSLLPDDHVLDLFVPITDFHGYEREIPLYDPRFVRDRTHRHVMHFRHQQPPTAQAESHFTADYDHTLAFSARATSSFPGAFPPVSFGDYAKALKVDVAKAFKVEPFFPLYALTGADPATTHFIDGGVLDNFPFGPAIAAIGGKPAATDVDRRLLFIEPDPGEGGGTPGDLKAPGLVKTVFGGYASIPRKEPILDDLLRLAERNETVLRIRDVIEASFPSIKTKVAGLVEGSAAAILEPDTSGDELIAMRQAVEALATEQAGFNAATYLRVRIRAVLEHFAEAVNALLGFDADSNQSAFVAGVLRTWAVSDRLLEQRPDIEITGAQVEFLSSLDLPYHRRRIRFLIAALSWLYRQAGDPEYGVPVRRELDVAKAKLYAHLFSLDSALPALAEDPTISGPLRDIFSPARIAAADTGTDEFVFGPYVAEHRAALVGVRDRIRGRLRAALPAFEKGLHTDLLDFLALCGPRLRDDVLTRYLGFPFWDMLVFPIQSVADVGERDHVEAYRISPNDTRLLGAQDLRGMSLFHFGAFFDRAGREGDYLWGRLDAVERLVKLLLDVRGHPPTLATTGAASAVEPIVGVDELAAECAPAFRAILAEEGPALDHARPLVEKLQEIVDGMAGG